MIKIICVGKVKEKFFKEAIIEYEKRLSKYTKLNIIEVADYSGKDNNKVLIQERDLILKHITDRDYVVILDVRGPIYSSEEVANKLNYWLISNSNIVFVIGGSNGLHEDLKTRSDFIWSFSKLTFPHHLFRVLLLEQVYRSFKIMNGESYHK